MRQTEELADNPDSDAGQIPGNLPINKRVVYAILMVILLISIGTFFFHNIERWNYVDSFYVSTVTLTTVGYGDITPKTDIGKIFTSFYALFGIGIVLYLLSSVIGQHFFQHEKVFDKVFSNLNNIKSKMQILSRGKKQ